MTSKYDFPICYKWCYGKVGKNWTKDKGVVMYLCWFPDFVGPTMIMQEHTLVVKNITLMFRLAWENIENLQIIWRESSWFCICNLSVPLSLFQIKSKTIMHKHVCEIQSILLRTDGVMSCLLCHLPLTPYRINTLPFPFYLQLSLSSVPSITFNTITGLRFSSWLKRAKSISFQDLFCLPLMSVSLSVPLYPNQLIHSPHYHFSNF